MSPRGVVIVLLLATLLFLLLLCCCGSEEREETPRPGWLKGEFPSDLPRPHYETFQLSIGGQQVEVEIADTAERRSYGMMFVAELPEDRGMLFLYPEPRSLGFWMRNTRVPLDIAFIAEIGGQCRIINAHSNMVPFQESPNYESNGRCRFALELQGGFLERHGVGQGDLLELPPRILTLEAAEDDLFRPNLPRRLGPDGQ